MHSQLQLDQITFLDGGGIFLEGRVEATDLVDRNSGGEGETLEDGFLVIYL
jgi:hypothetical protein